MGAERRSAVIQQKDKVMTAYHEGGHALVAMLTEASTPLYKATIMPRGHALGITQMLPELDKVSETKRELMAQIDVCMGGKVAEELIYAATRATTLDGLVVRVGQLSGGKAGAWATSEWFPCMVQSASRGGVGCFPDDNRACLHST